MAAFKDRHGREWTFEINPFSMKRVKSLTGVNLGQLFNDSMAPLVDLVSDPITFVDVLYVLCKPDCDRAGITDEQFGTSLVGNCLEDASDAFMQGLIDFFPNRQSDLLSKLMDKSHQLRDVLAKKAEAQLDQIDMTSIASASS